MALPLLKKKGRPTQRALKTERESRAGIQEPLIEGKMVLASSRFDRPAAAASDLEV